MRDAVLSGQWLVAREDGRPQDVGRSFVGSLPANHRQPATNHYSRGFTLVELLITVSIIAIMASMVLVALWSAQETARVQKTRALIAKLDNIIRDRYESYRTRRAPIAFTTATLLGDRSKMRLDVIRDLMRMEMPDRWSDVYDAPAAPLPPRDGSVIARPALNQAYYRKYISIAGTTWPPTLPNIFQNQNAECLYMIVMEAVSQEGDAREVFRPDSVADTDGDGFPEFVDAWGMPIQFLRWAPGFQSELQTPQRGTVESTPMGGQFVVVTAQPSSSLSSSLGSYVGGALLFIDDATGIVDTDKMARITRYDYNSGVARITCETPATTQQPAFQRREPSSGFGENLPNSGDQFFVVSPDPFDPRGTYPRYYPGASTPTLPDTSIPTFALYPLIFSAGPDKAYGVKDDTGTDAASRLHYSAVALNPFYVPPMVDLSFGLFLGSFLTSSPEPGFYVGCWNDNIHNHQLNTR